ncbi:uncharacterized protein LOC102722405 isoform X2 [Oryza brachyantha]|uniref:uncharacterized protein LOC102722405 isoform X2 n=1 Tax=Oryza brachyantha TaxID=4533 RepID=UPI00077622A1|nr:uncharacterized protein LOC102722405 isoform X2 [Oryza brachyantha]
MSKRRGGWSKSNKKKKACRNSGNKAITSVLYDAFEEESGSLIDYSKGAWSGLSQETISNLSETVVLLASFNGDRMHFAGTGIVVRIKTDLVVKILTSADLIRRSDRDKEIDPYMTIQVLLPNKKLARGWLFHSNLDYNIVVVVIKYFPGFRAACFDHEVWFGSGSKVVAVGRCFNSDKLMALSGVVTDEPTDCPEHLMISTCSITEAMAGGPLIDLHGNVVGMNFFVKESRTPFLPRNKIYQRLVRSCILWVEINNGGDNTSKRSTCEIVYNNFIGSSIGEAEEKNQELSTSSTSDSEGSSDEEGESETQKLPISYPSDSEEWEELLFPELIKPLPDDEFTQLLRKDLKPRNYPMPVKFGGSMQLKNTFEEEFAEDTWCKLSKKVALNTSRSVVSLASFKGEERFFVCTGIFIDFNGSTSRVLTSASLVRISADENKIADNLKIQVYLPNKRLAEGKLQHYNLNYNMAVVSINGFRCLRTAELHNQMQIKPTREVVAIGRIFESGKLMATSGILSDKESNLDCRELMISTCKITKAGIGGPLIDFDGDFVGMNFYGTEETHYLPRLMIQKLLKHFEGTDDDEIAIDGMPKRWPVPAPRWHRHPLRPPMTMMSRNERVWSSRLE